MKTQDIFISHDKNSNNNKFFNNDSSLLNNNKFSINNHKFNNNNKFLKDYFGNNNVKMINLIILRFYIYFLIIVF